MVKFFICKSRNEKFKEKISYVRKCCRNKAIDRANNNGITIQKSSQNWKKNILYWLKLLYYLRATYEINSQHEILKNYNISELKATTALWWLKDTQSAQITLHCCYITTFEQIIPFIVCIIFYVTHSTKKAFLTNTGAVCLTTYICP